MPFLSLRGHVRPFEQTCSAITIKTFCLHTSYTSRKPCYSLILSAGSTFFVPWLEFIKSQNFTLKILTLTLHDYPVRQMDFCRFTLSCQLSKLCGLNNQHPFKEALAAKGRGLVENQQEETVHWKEVCVDPAIASIHQNDCEYFDLMKIGKTLKAFLFWKTCLLFSQLA